MTTRARKALALVAGLAMLSGLLVALTPAVTPTHAAGASQLSTNSDDDYATVEFSDPWDYSNPADAPVSEVGGFPSYVVTNGVFDGTANPGASIILAEGIAGVVPTGRNTDLHPINANKYRKISFRMKADVGPAGVPGGFFWYSCDHIIPDCENGFPLTVHNGWNNYSFDIPSQTALFHPGGPAWSGTLKGLRFVPSGNTQTHIQLDYMRLTPSSGSDAPPAAPVPLPVMDSPSLAGGFDYATLVRRDAWDMSQPSDIYGPENMVYGFGNGLLNGLSIAPNYSDAHFYVPLAGPIDGNRFHRLTFNVFYEGPPGAGDQPGGGMVARLIWQTAGAPGVWQNSDDIAVYPGWNDISLDLATFPAYAITEPGTAGRIGWAGQQITAVRFDPDEDSGARRFLVDNIKVAEDDTGYSGQYDVKFHDAAWQPGTTADIYSTTSHGGFGGTRIARGIPVAQGVNTFHWAPNPLPAAPQWLYVVLHRGGTSAYRYAGGPLRMTASPSPIYGVNPFGSFEGLSVSQSGARARGWALDPDTRNPVRVDFWVDGRAPIGSLIADGDRQDVQRAYPGLGAAHGFDSTIAVPQGTHSVCAYAINTGAGGNQLLGCRTITVNTNPIGALDTVAAHVGFATVRGWTLDPNSTAPIQTHVYVDGKLFRVLTADDARPDIAGAFPGYGEDHGYHSNLTLPSGAHTVCTYGINTGPGANATLGCTTVVLPSNPMGSLDVVRTDSGGIKVRGWALDPDVTGPILVAMYVQGGSASNVTAATSRPDIAALFPSYGKHHGFVATLPGGSGKHTVCAYGINRGAGGNTLIGCATG
jgi:hypothetical protein